MTFTESKTLGGMCFFAHYDNNGIVEPQIIIIEDTPNNSYAVLYTSPSFGCNQHNAERQQ